MNFQTVNSGHQEVATSGSPVSLVSLSQPANRVDIQAKLANTGVIYVGGSNVKASIPQGIGLNPGDVYSIEKMSDLLTIFIDSTVNGNGVSFTWWVGEIN